MTQRRPGGAGAGPVTATGGAALGGGAPPAALAVLDVLTLLARHAEPLPAAAVARDLGLPRSTTYKLLTALTQRGFVTHVPESRRYGLGLAAFELGPAYSRQAPLARLGLPVVARLVDAVGESGHLAVLHGRDVLYVVEERAPGRPSLVSDVHVRLPAPLTASGLAMLSALPAAQVRALFPSREAFVRRTDTGPAAPGELRSTLTAVRARGYAHEVDSVTAGMESVGVAVRDAAGHPVAAVAVTWPSDRLGHPVPDVVQRLEGAAAEIGRRLGAPLP